jgi:predicted ATP-dependent endonuclease of OLD family
MPPRNRTKLLKMRIVNLGCVGPEGLEISMDDVLCLVGANNTGKSTILRAYELVTNAVSFTANDRCQRADGITSIELWAHIPEGIENIADRWKKDADGFKVVRTRWSWDEELVSKRETWDPAIEGYSEDANASGINEVFQSRLPISFRVGALENPQEEHKKLLTLVLQPIADKLKSELAQSDSKLKMALDGFEAAANEPVQEENEKINSIAQDINRSHNEIFPNLSISMDVSLERIPFDPLPALLKSSGIRFLDFGDRTTWNQQGTGSQRALFWAMLQVRSKLKSASDLKAAREKEKAGILKSIKKLEGEAAKAKKDDTKNQKSAEIVTLRTKLTALEQEPNEAETASLPGYMLLIDEPEIALHPSAIRAASRYLYALAQDPSWQVMMTTHSPVFVNPLEDHTTIVRLDRNADCLTPHIYRSDKIRFSDNPDQDARDKEELKMLNKFDSGLAELFFGQYPVLVEGDTEFTAFEGAMNRCPTEFPISIRPAIVRARGKDMLVLLIKILTHLKVSFSILHDSDQPLRKDGSANSAWSANERIVEAVTKARELGIRVIHRVAVPYFEKAFLPTLRSTSDKPWNVWRQLDDEAALNSIKTVLRDLLDMEALEVPFSEDFMTGLESRVRALELEQA